jgi:hypothetical protein
LVVTEEGELILKSVRLVPVPQGTGTTGVLSQNSTEQQSIDAASLDKNQKEVVLKGVVIGETGSVDITNSALSNLVWLNGVDEVSTPTIVPTTK